MKIIINRCYGGFGFSAEAIQLGGERGGNIDSRTCPIMVQIVEELGANASADYSDMKVVEIPDDVIWEVKDYDGCEWIAEVHRTWC